MEVAVNLLNKQPPSKTVFCHFLVLHIVILLLRQGVVADLKADREALVEFASAVGGGERLGWSRKAQKCSDWIGVQCGPSRVVGLRLSGMGLSGDIPENTIERLDALRALSLENNSFTGLLPSKLMNLKCLNVSNNGFNGSIPASLSSFPHSSFAGNALLCGPPLMNQPCHHDEHDINYYSELPSPSPPLLLRRLLKSKKKNRSTTIIIFTDIGWILLALSILAIILGLIWCYCNWDAVKKWWKG